MINLHTIIIPTILSFLHYHPYLLLQIKLLSYLLKLYLHKKKRNQLSPILH